MTDSAPPDITVDYSHAWVHITLGQDVDNWATEAAEQLWAAGEGPYSPLDVDLLASRLRALAEGLLATRSVGGFFLCPELARGPRAVVRLNALTYPTGTADEEILREVVLPDEEQVMPPEITELAGPGPRRIRIRQRAYAEDTRTVSDHVTYVLPFEGAAWILSTAFTDPQAADGSLTALDALIAGIELQVAE